MQLTDLPALAGLLPEVLSGNWSVAQLQSQLHSNHEFLVLVKNATAQENAALPETGTSSEIIVGFAEFYCVLDECHLLNFVIFRTWRQQGLAQLFIRELLHEIRERGCVQCLLEVRRSNLPAVRLYEKTGFVLNGVRPGYYPPLEKDGLREDALLYSWSLSASD